jgi:hypothetical protein
VTSLDQIHFRPAACLLIHLLSKIFAHCRIFFFSLVQCKHFNTKALFVNPFEGIRINGCRKQII